ncbi:large ribosomal subunit protein mL41 [Sebastes fasciatus]|uniref:large ribosomal subunit protein mL41 n=1 Tax=Sebastes fasciatus TaxID=394691 RepID=UPI003D9E3B23
MVLAFDQSLSASLDSLSTLLTLDRHWAQGFLCPGRRKRGDTMGVLSTLMRGLVRGADRMSEFTSKRGSRTHNKGRGARPTGLKLSSSKFLSIRTMIPEFVVPNLEGFQLKPYVSYRSPQGTEPPVTAQSVFAEVVAPQIKRDFEEGTFSKEQLEKYGFNPTQEGKLFKLYPKNYVR